MSLYFPKYDLGFIHIPKNAGTSVRHAISHFSSSPMHADGMPSDSHNHANIFQYVSKLRPNQVGNLETFCVVRNTYDRVVSVFKHWVEEALKSPNSYDFAGDLNRDSFKSYVLDIDKKGSQMFKHTVSQLWYICEHADKDMPTDLEQDDWYSKNVGLSYKESLVDHIFYYDELDALNQFLSDRFSQQITIGHKNQSDSKRPYRDFYDDECKETIRNLYQQEIDRFEFTF